MRLPPDMQASIDQIQHWLSEAINITRNMSVDISPSVLHGEGLVEAIDWLAARMKEQHNLEVEIRSTHDFSSLPDHMRVTLFQTVRELLFNVVKHAGVLQATVTMEKLDEHARITISDAGTGFDAQTVLSEPQASHGLLIVRNRLSLMGGSITVEAVRGKGTRAKIEFPIDIEK
jgi:signal transduction histidine kinase